MLMNAQYVRLHNKWASIGKPTGHVSMHYYIMYKYTLHVYMYIYT